MVREGNIRSAGNIIPILETRKKTSPEMKYTWIQREAPSIRQVFAVISVWWRNLQELSKFVPPAPVPLVSIPCHPWYQGFISMKEAVTSPGLHYDVITGSLRSLTKRDSLLFWIQISLLMRNIGRRKKKRATPNEMNAAGRRRAKSRTELLNIPQDSQPKPVS